MNLYLILFIPIGLSFQVCDHKSCDACLRDAEICAWCYENDFKITKRCIPAKDIPENWCPNHILNPNSTIKLVKDLNFSSTIGNVVQTKPQILDVNIRPGSSVDIKFAFQRADNYPVDLYFLFDGSESMIKIQNETANQIEDVYNMMLKMTNNILLGMGSFVDKNALPFTHLKNSTRTYSFHNRLKLNSDLELFKETMNNAPFGGNYDPQEGILDGLAQVLVCKKEIGWRSESTKIIVVLTNQPYHAAGDGKYAGIFQPYDGGCYLKKDKYYKELEMDYPSVGIINKLASDEQIIVLFAIETDVKNTYKALSDNIRGARYATYNGNKITKILSNIYKGIIQMLILNYKIGNSYQKYFDISFNPDCLNNPRSRDCRVQEETEKEITCTIKLLEYIEVKHTTIDILFEGVKEKIQINVNVIKDCDCEKKINSSLCNGGGTLNCGVCDCYGDRYGEKCHNPNDFSTCIAVNTTAVCSNHGHCYRGKCSCKEGYEGDYCECKVACPQGADDRCECICGACKCKPGWGGSLCKCPSPPDCGDENTCNGLGNCICGKCKCQDTANWDARTKKDKYCKVTCSEESCHERQCLILESLVLSYLKEDGFKFEDNINITMEKNLTLFNSSDSTWYLCPQLRIDVGCYTKFIYSYSKEIYALNVKIQSDFDYAETYYLLGGVSLILLILIGLATLIAWKYLTDRRDRLEFERFKEEVAASVMCDNPIFLAATNTFQNPTFGKRSFKS